MQSWIIFFALLAILTYLEEGFGDGLVWREHTTVFGWLSALPTVTFSTANDSLYSGWLHLATQP